MSDYNEQTLMEAVITRVAATPDPRLRQIMTSLGSQALSPVFYSSGMTEIMTRAVTRNRLYPHTRTCTKQMPCGFPRVFRR